MKKSGIIFCIYWAITSFTNLQAQVFEIVDSLNLPNLTSSNIIWADLDNNAFQDAIISGKSATGTDTIFFISNAEEVIDFLPSNLPALSNTKIDIADFNHDALLDILIMGNNSEGKLIIEVWENKNEFTFEKSAFTFDGWQSGTGIWVDVDRNGDYDIVFSGIDTSGESQLLFYMNTNGTFTEVLPDLPALIEANIAQLDANRDGQTDLIISGLTNNDSGKTILLLNEGGTSFESVDIQNNIKASALNIGDINHDGRSDVIISGVDETGNMITNLFTNRGDGEFELYQTLNNYQANELLIADLDKNGLADIFFAGLNESGENTTVIYQYDSLATQPTYIVLDTLLPKNTNAGLSDVDNDGDLDVLFVEGSSTGSGLYINNFEGENLNPSTPTNPFAIAIHGQTIFSWASSVDDHTSTSALTYEVFAGDSEFAVDHVSPYFETSSGIRKMPRHGTAWQTSFYSLNKLLSGKIYWGVHPIDNSLANNASNGICFGNVLYDCVDINLQDTVLCAGNTLKLVDPIEDEQAIWFSVKQGYLGTFDTLNIDLAASDTIFYVVPNDFDCALATSWSVEILPEQEEISLGNDTTVCIGETLDFTIPGESWTSIVWSSAQQGILSSENSIAIEVNENDMLTVSATNEAGCVFEDSIKIGIYDTRAFASEDVTIQRGESTQLEAFNALSYLWSPNAAIDDTTSASPTVSPLSNTSYFVEMVDSTGCTVVDTVVVTVEGLVSSAQIFIPNLFTPNNDGNNDTFKLYGLQQVSSISFHIFDTQGNVVFKSEDVNSLTSTGWDGSKGGRVLKNGTYFWRIDGQYQNGEPINFNGENQGFITLLR